MYRRDVTQAQFEMIRGELRGARTTPGTVPVTTGQHELYGEVGLLKEENGPFVVLAERASFLDRVFDEGASPLTHSSPPITGF